MKHLILLLALALPAAAQTLTNTNLDGVTNATINGKLDDDAVASRAAMSLGTAATADKSTIGGAGKIPQLNSAGSLQLFSGTITGDALISADGVGGYGGPAIYLADSQRLWMLNTAKNSGGSVFYNTNHGADGGEVQFNSDHRIALCLGPSGALQIGLGSSAEYNKQYAYMQSRGTATSGIQTINSLPLYFQPLRWNGSSSVVTQAPSIQGVADGTTGDAFLDFSAVGAQPYNGADGARTLNMRLSKEGVWEAGKAPAFDSLTSASNVFTQTCSIYKTVQNAKITLAATNSLVISGAVAGMRGVIYVTQDGTGSRTLTLPENSALPPSWALSTVAVATDRLAWEYDGTYFLWTITKAFDLPVDADANAFFVRQNNGGADTTTTVEKFALNTLVRSLKAASLWGKFSAVYPFVGSTAVAQGHNLLGGATTVYNINWVNSPTFSANGVTGNGTNAYGDTGINLSTLSAQNSASVYMYVRSEATSLGYFCGVSDASSRFGFQRNGSYMGRHGPNSQTNNTAISATTTDFSDHYAMTRSSTAIDLYQGSSVATASEASTGVANYNVFLLCRNNTGGPSGYSDANLAFFAIGNQVLTANEWTTFRAIVDTYQTTLGRANP